VERAATPSGKIIAPGVPAALVERPALSDLLAEAGSRRLTCVVAGAGFGKSTLLATWATSVRSAWYTAGPEDSSLAPFGRGIVDALKLRLPDLPSLIGPALDSLHGPNTDEAARAEALAGLLCSALHDQLVADLVLVIDDVHEIASTGSSIGFIEALCRQAPESFHLVLASRTDPPFPIDRLRGRGQVLEIDASALAFNEDETASMLRVAVDPDAAELAPTLHRTTAGWPAALRLAVEALRTAPGPERSRIVDGLPRPGGPLFAYLAHEVFAAEPGEVRELVKRVARLRRFTPELCEDLGISDAELILQDLERRGIFIVSEGHVGRWYSTSTLGREFALKYLPLSSDEESDALRRAAQWFEKHGHFDEALDALESLRDEGAIHSVLKQYGAIVLSGGHVERIISASDLLSAELRDADVDLLAGQARLVRGDWEGALQCFRRAAGDSTTYPAGLAWRMGLIHHLRGDFDGALAVYERADIDEPHGSDEALLLAWKASILWVKGDAAGCRVNASASLAAATNSGNAQALAAAHTVLAMVAALEGDRRADEAHYFLALNAAEQAGDVLQLIRIGANRAADLNDDGAYADALAEVDRIMPLAEMAGFATFLGLCLINRGDALLGLGRLEEAMAAYESSRPVYERIGSSDLCYSLVGVGDVYRERGELALARSAYEEGVRVAEEVGDTQGLIPALAGLARVIASEDLERALSLLGRADSFAPSIYQNRAVLARGWVLLGTGDRASATAIADRVAELAHARRDRARLAEALELAALAATDAVVITARLRAAGEIWAQLGNPIGRLRVELASATLGIGQPHSGAESSLARLRALGIRTGASAAGPLAILEAQRHMPVTVMTLGGLRLLREGRPVPVVEWQSKKARDLLKILVSRRGRMTPRELLMETLWSDEAPEKLANRLSVALTTVRTILDPEKRFDAEHFVIADKSAVGLDFAHMTVDVEDFLNSAREGFGLGREGRHEEATAMLIAAEETYTGDFLEEDPYEDWSVALREEARATYVSVARSLAGTALEASDYDSAARYYLRLLERDPYDEQAHLGLVRTMNLGGRHGEARRWYRTYVTRMHELGVEPAPFPTAA
jgi:ATP/maltotriose-dependent transcriptional regulator MalT